MGPTRDGSAAISEHQLEYGRGGGVVGPAGGGYLAAAASVARGGLDSRDAPSDDTVVRLAPDVFGGQPRVEWLRWVLPPGVKTIRLPLNGTARLWVDDAEVPLRELEGARWRQPCRPAAQSGAWPGCAWSLPEGTRKAACSGAQ